MAVGAVSGVEVLLRDEAAAAVGAWPPEPLHPFLVALPDQDFDPGEVVRPGNTLRGAPNVGIGVAIDAGRAAVVTDELHVASLGNPTQGGFGAEQKCDPTAGGDRVRF
jgi:hypothetical protein